MRTLTRVVLLLTAAVVAFTASAQTYQYVLEPGSTITPSYYGTPVGPTEPLSGTFSWTFVSFDSYWSTYNFNTTALNFHSPSYTLTLNSSPDNGGTSGTSLAASFSATVNATGAPLSSSPLTFVPWPANDGSYEGDPSAPSRLIFVHERLDPPTGALISFTAVLIPEPSAAALMTVCLISFSLIHRKRRCLP
jgi:hypothetical protein